MPRISEKGFSKLLQSKLGGSWNRALTAFHNYGENLAYDVTNVLLHAADQGKVAEVLDILEKHYQDRLLLLHPEIRGTVIGINPTEAIFLRVCRDTLGLQPGA